MAGQDEEGRQTMRVLARNMSFLMKSIALGREKYGLPEQENGTPTHFIRLSQSLYCGWDRCRILRTKCNQVHNLR